jgi:hypothetical protein
MELTERERAAWLRAFFKAVRLSDMEGEIFLTFDAVRPYDRKPIALDVSPRKINIDPLIFDHLTGEHFKLVSILHEIEHYKLGHDPITFIIHPTECEIEAYQAVYKRLATTYGKDVAKLMILDFVRERIKLGKRIGFPKRYDSKEEFVKTYLPFLR